MIGLSRTSGAAIDAVSDQHLVQSIGDILGTPLGSRIGRRDYGSDLPDLIDQPMNAMLRIRIFAATAMALLKWEPRVRLKRVRLSADATGHAGVSLEVLRLDRPLRSTDTLFVPFRTA